MRLIDADELIDDINNYEFTEYSDYSNIIDIIDYSLAIEAKPIRYEHWILTKRVDDSGQYVCVCSECGSELRVLPEYYNFLKNERFCYNCGVKMNTDLFGQTVNS